jgi:ABC-type branched-subunit amino acid transport system substrate-binding protein
VDLRFVQSVLVEGMGVNPPLADFARRYRIYYGLQGKEPILAPAGTVQAYDLTEILVRAVARAGRTDHQAIRTALEEVPFYAGIIQTYAPPFTPSRHDALSPGALRLARYNEFGQIVAAH